MIIVSTRSINNETLEFKEFLPRHFDFATSVMHYLEDLHIDFQKKDKVAKDTRMSLTRKGDILNGNFTTVGDEVTLKSFIVSVED